MVTTTIVEGDASLLPTNLASAIEWLTAKLHSIPKAHRKSATVAISARMDWDDPSPEIIIAWTRPETRAERKARQSPPSIARARHAIQFLEVPFSVFRQANALQGAMVRAVHGRSHWRAEGADPYMAEHYQ